MVLDTRRILEDLGYDYMLKEEPGCEPPRADVTFGDLLESFKGSELGGERLYRHQLEAVRALEEGHNVVLVAGTGSGKTEAWFLYAAMHGRRCMAVYPTLALSNDQVQRLERYSKLLGREMAQVDAPSVEQFKGRRRALREAIGRAFILVTNPAFLFQDLKRYASSPARSYIVREAANYDVLVLDELDYYSPRELALIMGMLKIFSQLGWKPQVAVLTATLSNPEELAGVLSGVNGRASRIIRGEPFRVPNRVYVVLGRNLESIRRGILEQVPSLDKLEVGPDIKAALTDPERFRGEAYRIVPLLRSMGLKVDTPHVDPVEIIGRYLDDEGVTLVFTRSIGRAEELARRLRQRLPPDKAAMVAAHHHLVDKAERARIEEAARRGAVKVIFTPRTLVQGIDIGKVIRIVHVGLPDDVREFHQREGRKGRRRHIEFTETIVIPGAAWDHELLGRGLHALAKWIELPLEKCIVNPENKYLSLFTGLFKLAASKALGLSPEEEELRLLNELRLARMGELTQRGKRTWQWLNFYEFGPPYGVKRVKVADGEATYLQEASHVDVVEKLQPGCIDFTSDNIVTGLRTTRGRWVTVVEEEPLTRYTLYRYEFLAMAFEEYCRVKSRWGETPDPWRDYVRGNLRSHVVCTMHPPREGFGRYLEVPYRVAWIVESDRISSTTVGGRTYVYRLRRAVDVPAATMGRYEDYSYGRVYELPADINLDMARLGLALVKVVLRRVMGVALKAISYDLSTVGGRKLLVLFEDDAAGLIEKMDWLEVRRALEGYTPDELDEVLVNVVDEIAHMKLVETGFRWDLARSHALAVLDSILASERLKLVLRGVEVSVPRPSRALKLLSMDLLRLPLVESGDVSILFVAYFDGEESECAKLMKEFYLVDSSAGRLLHLLSRYVNEGFKVVVYGVERVLAELDRGGLIGLKALLQGLEAEGRIVDAASMIRGLTGLEVGADELAGYLNLRYTYTIEDVRREYEESLRRIRELPYSKWLYFTKYLSEKTSRYMAERARNIYLLHLALQSMGDKARSMLEAAAQPRNI